MRHKTRKAMVRLLFAIALATLSIGASCERPIPTEPDACELITRTPFNYDIYLCRFEHARCYYTEQGKALDCQWKGRP